MIPSCEPEPRFGKYFGLGVGALFFVGLVDPRIRFASLVRCAVLITLPAVVVYGVWRYYVANELAGREFTIRPFDDWSIDLLPSILGNMVYVLLKKSAYLAAMLAAMLAALRQVHAGRWRSLRRGLWPDPVVSKLTAQRTAILLLPNSKLYRVVKSSIL